MGTRRGLTKSALAHARRELALYQRVLPSLELKRAQLVAERWREQRSLRAAEAALADEAAARARAIPMLALDAFPIEGMTRAVRIELDEERLLGAALPRLRAVTWERRAYGLLVKPHWVDTALDAIEALGARRIALSVQAERLRRLDAATNRLFQRINLFRKLLVPQARHDIERIRIALADAERATVVRSKLFKARHAALIAQALR